MASADLEVPIRVLYCVVSCVCADADGRICVRANGGEFHEEAASQDTTKHAYKFQASFRHVNAHGLW